MSGDTPCSLTGFGKSRRLFPLPSLKRWVGHDTAEAGESHARCAGSVTSVSSDGHRGACRLDTLNVLSYRTAIDAAKTGDRAKYGGYDDGGEN